MSACCCELVPWTWAHTVIMSACSETNPPQIRIHRIIRSLSGPQQGHACRPYRDGGIATVPYKAISKTVDIRYWRLVENIQEPGRPFHSDTGQTLVMWWFWTTQRKMPQNLPALLKVLIALLPVLGIIHAHSNRLHYTYKLNRIHIQYLQCKCR